MANKKVSQLTSKSSVLVTDLFPIADPSTGQLYKTTISDLGTAIGSGVSSVNGLVGAVVLDTDDIQELVSPTNKWFTDTRARAALSASSPLAYNSSTGVFSIPAATSSQNGYLTSTDWTTFNNKLSTATAASTYVPYTGATANVNLGQNYSLTAALIIKSGGTSTQFLKADGTIDTNTYALDSAVVKLTGNQTVAGVKTFTSGIVADVTTGGTQGFASTNSSASGSSIFLQNNSTSVGNAIGINNTSTADGIAIGNETSGRGIYISNATTSGSGKGISIDNYNGGIGIEVGSDSTADAIKILHLSGRAFNIQSSGGGYGVIINNTTASTSAPFTIQKQGANKITFTDAGAGTFVSTISAAGATLTGALSGTTANFSSLVSIIGTSADFILVRANNSNTANILFGTNNTYSWSAGLRNIENENFYIYNQTNSTNSVTINNSTNAVTLAGALSGTSATFSSSVTAGIITSNVSGGSDNTSTFEGAGSYLHLKGRASYTKLYFDGASSTLWSMGVEGGSDFQIRSTDTTPRLWITSSGNVGIGTTSPSSILEIAATTPVLRIQASDSANFHGIEFRQGAGFDAFIKQLPSTGEFRISNGRSAGWGGHMTFYTDTSERMRITSGGKLIVGATSDGNTGLVQIHGTARAVQLVASQGGITAGNYAIYGHDDDNGYINVVRSVYTGDFHFRFDGTTRATINRSTGVYVATSDINKKKDLEESKIGLNEVMQLKPTLYRMKIDSDNSEKQLGFIAQEVKGIIPSAYQESGDFIGLNFNPIVAALTKAVQELKAELDTLKNK